MEKEGLIDIREMTEGDLEEVVQINGGLFPLPGQGAFLNGSC